jgi:hypothetical protein
MTKALVVAEEWQKQRARPVLGQVWEVVLALEARTPEEEELEPGAEALAVEMVPVAEAA